MRYALLSCLLVVLLAGCTTPPADEAIHQSPYVDQQATAIRGLSAEEIEELQTGAGMGLARPAELNGYPGPVHVLELADELDLDADQRAEVAAIRQQMLDAAIPLGESILQAYEALEASFRARDIDEDALRLRLDRLSALYEELHFVHLVAHLEMAQVMSEDQATRYMALRGYHDDPAAEGHDRSDDRAHDGHDGSGD